MFAEGLSWKFLVPKKLEHIRKKFRNESVLLLDVGCGRRSCAIAKYWLPKVIYHGIDKEHYQGETQDYALMDRFIVLDLAQDDLSVIEDEIYTAIIFSHVIEHLPNGLEVLRRLTKKLKRGGIIYVEFPSVRSLSLPNADGTLNFCDDPTHVRIYDIKEIGNILLEQNFRIIRAGRATQLKRLVLVTPVGVLYSFVYFLRRGRLSARGLWDLMGFADFVLAERR